MSGRFETKALIFYKLIASFNFFAAFVLTRSTCDLRLSVTKLLQGKEIDIADA